MTAIDRANEAWRREAMLAGGGGPPHDGGMETRVAKLEQAVTDVRERLARIEAKVDSVNEHGATKAQIEQLRGDMATLSGTMIKWFVATAAVMSGLAFAIARLVQ